jgi:hypothetical protein
MSLQQLFIRVIDNMQAQNAFADHDKSLVARIFNKPSSFITPPMYEGEFPTQTDASQLLSEGVDIPQEVINHTRISVARSLDKMMPDWAVAEWLDYFLKNIDSEKIPAELFKFYCPPLYHIPSGGDKPSVFFDFRIDYAGVKNNFDNALFKLDELRDARTQMLEDQTYIIIGVMLYQYALRAYNAEMEAQIKNAYHLPPQLAQRIKTFNQFLLQSAMILASFVTMWPLAILVYNKDKIRQNEMLNDDMVMHALQKFAEQGGYMRKSVVEHKKFFDQFMQACRDFLKKPIDKKPRVIICAAREALIRWTQLSLPSFQGRPALAAYIKYARDLTAQHPAWQALATQIQGVLGQSQLKQTAQTCYEEKPSSCPYAHHHH